MTLSVSQLPAHFKRLSLKQLPELANSVGQYVKDNQVRVLLLVGEPGAGKTTFTRFLASSLAGKELVVPSPSYNLYHIHKFSTNPKIPDSQESFKLVHMDLYRVADCSELGISDLIEENQLFVCEWPGIARQELEEYAAQTISIQFRYPELIPESVSSNLELPNELEDLHRQIDIYQGIEIISESAAND